MRQKLIQWLLKRIFVERRLDLGKKSLDLGVCSGGAAEGTGRGFARRFLSAVRVDYGADGLRTAEMPWNFRSSRFYAVPVAAGRSDGNGVGSREGSKGERKINRAIVARMVRLVGDGSNDILSRYEALNRAQQAGLDLVEVDGRADPPVCKLMDFSKERFKVKKQEKDLRKKQLERRRLDDLKEVRFSSRTEQKDLDMKADVVTRLLVRGHRVKLVVQFHGNDKGEEVGVKLLEQAMNLLQAEFKVENGPRVEKMRAWVMIRPIQEQKNTKNKKSSNAMSKDENVDD